MHLSPILGALWIQIEYITHIHWECRLIGCIIFLLWVNFTLDVSLGVSCLYQLVYSTPTSGAFFQIYEYIFLTIPFYRTFSILIPHLAFRTCVVHADDILRHKRVIISVSHARTIGIVGTFQGLGKSTSSSTWHEDCMTWSHNLCLFSRISYSCMISKYLIWMLLQICLF